MKVPRIVPAITAAVALSGCYNPALQKAKLLAEMGEQSEGMNANGEAIACATHDDSDLRRMRAKMAALRMAVGAACKRKYETAKQGNVENTRSSIRANLTDLSEQRFDDGQKVECVRLKVTAYCH